jgi:hypothetical protein
VATMKPNIKKSEPVKHPNQPPVTIVKTKEKTLKEVLDEIRGK